jgi:predicted amidohydrolase
VRVGACETAEILGDVDAAVRTVHDFATRADAARLDLLLFPECFLQGYLVTEKHLGDHALAVGSPRMGQVLARLRGVQQLLVIGLIELDGGAYFNSALVIDQGQIVGQYRKTFLMKGESLFTAGDAFPTFICRGVRFGINICSDTRVPAAAAARAAAGARLLLVPAQNMMRRETALHWQERHNQVRRERVLETGMWLASADVTGQRGADRIGVGPTCVIDPAGRVVDQVPTGTTGLAVAQISTR